MDSSSKMLIEAAKRYAPAIADAVSGVEDEAVRGAIAGELLRRLFDSVPREGSFERPIKEGRAGSESKNSGKTVRSTPGRIAELIKSGFFDEPRSVAAVEQELRVLGFYHNNADTRMSLLRLARKKCLRRLPGAEGAGRTYDYVKI